jgi:hypothetical protein
VTFVERINEVIADEAQPRGVRVSVVPSVTEGGAAEIHLSSQSPHHLSVIKVPAGSGSDFIESLYLAGVLKHQQAFANLGGKLT